MVLLQDRKYQLVPLSSQAWRVSRQPQNRVSRRFQDCLGARVWADNNLIKSQILLETKFKEEPLPTTMNQLARPLMERASHRRRPTSRPSTGQSMTSSILLMTSSWTRGDIQTSSQVRKVHKKWTSNKNSPPTTATSLYQLLQFPHHANRRVDLFQVNQRKSYHPGNQRKG